MKCDAASVLRGLPDPWEWRQSVLRNVENRSPTYAASHPKNHNTQLHLYENLKPRIHNNFYPKMRNLKLSKLLCLKVPSLMVRYDVQNKYLPTFRSIVGPSTVQQELRREPLSTTILRMLTTYTGEIISDHECRFRNDRPVTENRHQWSATGQTKRDYTWTKLPLNYMRRNCTILIKLSWSPYK